MRRVAGQYFQLDRTASGTASAVSAVCVLPPVPPLLHHNRMGKFVVLFQAPHQPHRHGHEELLIIKQGKVEALIDGKWLPAGPGSVIFLASNQLHGLRNVGADQAVYHVIAWTSSDTPPDAK